VDIFFAVNHWPSFRPRAQNRREAPGRLGFPPQGKAAGPVMQLKAKIDFANFPGAKFIYHSQNKIFVHKIPFDKLRIFVILFL
jgi:hypothetical protein